MNNLENLPHSCKEARKLNIRYFYTGKPCKHGHIDKRDTSNRRCYTCIKNYFTSDKVRKRHRTNQLKKYNLSMEDQNKLLEKQNNKCAICETVFSKTAKNTFPCVDHNHTTGKVRGLLCSNCNLALGYVNDNINILKNSIKYLISHSH